MQRSKTLVRSNIDICPFVQKEGGQLMPIRACRGVQERNTDELDVVVCHREWTDGALVSVAIVAEVAGHQTVGRGVISRAPPCEWDEADDPEESALPKIRS